MRGDGARWNDRYVGRMTGDPVAPTGIGGLVLRRGGLCLDVACGLGEQSLWAAQHGFEVVALDASDVAITALNTAALALGVRDRIDTRVVDLDSGLPTEFASRCSLVICQRFRDPELYSQLALMAEPGGLIVCTVLSEVGLDGEPGDFHAAPGELVDAFRELDVVVLRSVEDSGAATLVARRQGSTPQLATI